MVLILLKEKQKPQNSKKEENDAIVRTFFHRLADYLIKSRSSTRPTAAVGASVDYMHHNARSAPAHEFQRRLQMNHVKQQTAHSHKLELNQETFNNEL